MTSLDLFCDSKIKELEEKNSLRSLKEAKFLDANYIKINNKKYLNFASNDYFAMANNKLVKAHAIKAIKQYGVGGTSSRLISGNHHYYKILEEKIAKIKNTESALIFGSGFLTSAGILQALIDKDDLIIADKFIHASLLDGAKLTKAELKRFNHNDLEHLEYILNNNSKNYKKIIIISETIFSMDGDQADLKSMLKIAKKYQAYLLADDAHGFGVIASNLKDESYIQMGTLSKAIGSYGGYVAGSKKLIDYLASSARSLIYTTSLPIPVVAAACKAIDLIVNKDKYKVLLDKNINLFAENSGLKNNKSPIFIKEFKNIKAAEKAHSLILKKGFYTAFIRPPTAKTARIRISLNSLHRKRDVKNLALLLRSL